jgi:hypothetical protein
MIELGLLAGDPTAADTWTHEQRLRGLGWWMARIKGAPSAAFLGPSDLRTVWREVVAAYEGLRAFLVNGLVATRQKK